MDDLGSHIFELAGIPAQETLLGTFMLNGKEKIVVACKDFTSTGLILQDFTSLKNAVLSSDMIQMISKQKTLILCKQNVKKKALKTVPITLSGQINVLSYGICCTLATIIQT